MRIRITKNELAGLRKGDYLTIRNSVTKLQFNKLKKADKLNNLICKAEIGISATLIEENSAVFNPVVLASGVITKTKINFENGDTEIKIIITNII